MPEDRGNGDSGDKIFRTCVDHPCDVALKEHIMSTHKSSIESFLQEVTWLAVDKDLLWDVYKAGISYKERIGIPVSGPSIDRRAFQYTSYV